MRLAINNLPSPKSRSKTEELVRKYHETGDPTYRQEAITGALRYVAKLVNSAFYGERWGRVNPQSYDPSDLFQAGVTGLCEAVDKFDPENGATFHTLMLYPVRYEIQEVIRTARGHTSLDKPHPANEPGGGDITLLSTLTDETSSPPDLDSYRRQQIKVLKEFQKTLENEYDLEIWRRRILAGDKLREVAEVLGFSRQYAYKVEKRVREKLKTFLEDNKFYKTLR